MTNRERAESLLSMVEPWFAEVTAFRFEKIGLEFLAAAQKHFDTAVAAEREANDKILTDMQSESNAYRQGAIDLAAEIAKHVQRRLDSHDDGVRLIGEMFRRTLAESLSSVANRYEASRNDPEAVEDPDAS